MNKKNIGIGILGMVLMAGGVVPIKAATSADTSTASIESMMTMIQSLQMQVKTLERRVEALRSETTQDKDSTTVAVPPRVSTSESYMTTQGYNTPAPSAEGTASVQYPVNNQSVVAPPQASSAVGVQAPQVNSAVQQQATPRAVSSDQSASGYMYGGGLKVANMTTSDTVVLEEVAGQPAVSCTVPQLTKGARTQNIYLVQQALKEAGYYPEGFITGYYGNLTAQAVERLERSKGLVVTGKIEGPTIEAVNGVVKAEFAECATVETVVPPSQGGGSGGGGGIVPSVYEVMYGTLRATGPTISMWGSHTFQTEQMSYQVKAENDIVAAKLKSASNKYVKLTGRKVWNDFEGGFTGIVAIDVDDTGIETAKMKISAPTSKDAWMLGEVRAIKWETSESLKDKTVTIALGFRTPACVYSNPPCLIALVAPYTIAKQVANTGQYSWVVPTNLPSMYRGKQVIMITVDNTETRGESEEFTMLEKETARNTPPVISAVSGPEKLEVNEQGTWKVNAYDPDGKYLSYEVNWGDVYLEPVTQPNMPAFLRIENEATFTHKYVNPGIYSVTIVVRDESGAVARSTREVIVGKESSNHAPRIISFPKSPSVMYVGQRMSYSFEAVDDDNDNLSWSVDWGEGTLGYLEASACSAPICSMYSTSHAWSKAGEYAVKVKVTDNKGGSDVYEFRVNVKSQNANKSPVIMSVGGPTSLKASEVGAWKVSAYDPEGGYLSYQVYWGDTPGVKEGVETAPLFQSFQSTSFTHAYNDTGVYQVTISVSDEQGESAKTTITVNVE